MKVALTGDVALDLLSPYFREAGYETYVPAGFATWRQELLDDSSPLHRFKPDYVFDVTEAAKRVEGEVENFLDERMAKLASMPYSLDGIRAIVDEFGYWRLKGARKVLAVDADNTLWRGILSEDGEENLTPIVEFHQGLKALRQRGVVLVLLSKNDLQPIEHAFDFLRQKFGDALLDISDFAAVKVNWGPKAGNLLEAMRELNLGVDSAVFADDNPYERAQMAAHLPEVTVLPWNGWSADGAPLESQARQLLRRMNDYCFGEIGLTAEDRLRAADYASRKAIANYRTLNDYLNDLELQVMAGEAKEGDLDRLAQMAAKTNQFNATTIRRSREDFAKLLADGGAQMFVFRTRDRFAEQGLVCYIIVQDGRITDFVMSCRAMGRTLEIFALDYVRRQLGFVPPIDFVPSAKNRPFADFLKVAGNSSRTYYWETKTWQQKR